MALTAERKEILKLMHGIVDSYRTLSISNVRGFSRLAKDYFNEEVNIEPTRRQDLRRTKTPPVNNQRHRREAEMSATRPYWFLSSSLE